MTIVRVHNLRLNAEVGAYAHERGIKREIIVNLEYEIDGTKSAQEDNLKHIVDYHPLAKQITEQIENNQFHIIEYVAAFILEMVMSYDERILRATVTVDKPKAIGNSDSTSATVSTER